MMAGHIRGCTAGHIIESSLRVQFRMVNLRKGLLIEVNVTVGRKLPDDKTWQFL